MKPQKQKFTVDRYGFDRSVWISYFQSTVQNSDNNAFDPDLIEYHDLEDKAQVKYYNGFGKETILRNELGSSWCEKNGTFGPPCMSTEMRLKKTRSMKTYFNFNRYFINTKSIQHKINTVLHDDNFIPADIEIKTEEYLDVYKNWVPNELEKIYRKYYETLWPEEYTKIVDSDEPLITKCITLEVIREMAPLDVSVVACSLTEIGTSFTSFNGTSKTIYFEPELKDKKFEDFKVDGVKIQTPILNWKKKEPYKNPVKHKLYQKAANPSLGRFEVTYFSEDADFSLANEEDIKMSVDCEMSAIGLIPKSNKSQYRQTFTNMAKWLKLPEDYLANILRNGSQWKATRANKAETAQLLRRHIISKNHRGDYTIDPILTEIYFGTEPNRPIQKMDFKVKYL